MISYVLALQVKLRGRITDNTMTRFVAWNDEVLTWAWWTGRALDGHHRNVNIAQLLECQGHLESHKTWFVTSHTIFSPSDHFCKRKQNLITIIVKCLKLCRYYGVGFYKIFWFPYKQKKKTVHMFGLTLV